MAHAPEQLHPEFQEAFNGLDLDAVVELYEPNALLITAGASVQGAKAIRDFYRSTLAKRPSIALTTTGVSLSDEIALLQGEWTLSETDADGGSLQRSGRNTEVARRQADGRWLFVIDHPGSATP